ncbi:MAG TPA: PsiF family protein [Burkholderiales bacterium]|nr:PsiF family protein [Burkholderiales bacterium]
MKQIIAVLGIALLVTPVLAATDQQEKTKACNAAAAKKGLKGEKRKAFVKDCLAAQAKKKPEAKAKPKTKTARPATPAARPPAATAPAQPSAAAAAPPPANPPAPSPGSATDKKRLKCEELARQSNVSPSRKNAFMTQCMSG